MINLSQLLESRDARAQHQKDLLGKYPGKSLLCLTVQLPGPEKRNAQSLAIARAGVSAIRQAFQPDYEELRDLETGYEGYFLVAGDPLDVKRRACQIEDTHPLGRLMDIDVLTAENYFLQGFAKNQFSAASDNEKPTAEANFFSQGFAKNQFAPANATPTRVHIISREDIGLASRRCLLCDNVVRFCMRAKTHTTNELLKRIEQLLKEYELQAP